MNGGDFKDKIPEINNSVLKAMKTRCVQVWTLIVQFLGSLRCGGA